LTTFLMTIKSLVFIFFLVKLGYNQDIHNTIGSALFHFSKRAGQLG
jgi:hypothetical protein